MRNQTRIVLEIQGAMMPEYQRQISGGKGVSCANLPEVPVVNQKAKQAQEKRSRQLLQGGADRSAEQCVKAGWNSRLTGRWSALVRSFKERGIVLHHFHELAHRMRLTRRNHVTIGLALLEPEPHCFYIFPCVAPVSLCVRVLQPKIHNPRHP